MVRARLIGVWPAGAREARRLATDLENAASKVVAYYDRRTGIGGQFRDAKGHRLGLKLRWAQLTRAEFVEQMYLLAGVALLLRTAAGRAAEESGPRARLESKTKGARLPLVRAGAYYWREVTRRLRLTAKSVREHLPPPRLRMFNRLRESSRVVYITVKASS